MRMYRIVVAALILVSVIGIASVSAASFESPNYTIDGSVGDSISGLQQSTNYEMVSAGGASIAGDSASGSYKLASGYIATLENSLQLTLQPGGLISYWSFDQGTGTTVVDDSANSLAARFSGSPSWVPGKIGSGIGGFSTQDYLIASHDSSYNISRLSVCSWLNPGTIDDATVIARAGSTWSDGMWSVGLTADNKLDVSVQAGGSRHTIVGTSVFSPGVWGYACVMYDGSDLIAYVNGEEEGRLAVNLLLSPITQPLSVGALADGSQHFSGNIDEVKLFDRVLSAEEIRAAYDAGAVGLPAGLAFGEGITPGQSKTTEYEAVIQTSAAGYGVAVNQSQDLTSQTTSIPAVSGDITSPIEWDEGVTNGLGFTLHSTNATTIPSVWGGGDRYAKLPLNPTTFYNRSGKTAGTKDVLGLRLRLDVSSSQPNGQYHNQMILTGTITP